jgi:hypothetical protein
MLANLAIFWGVFSTNLKNKQTIFNHANFTLSWLMVIYFIVNLKYAIFYAKSTRTPLFLFTILLKKLSSMVLLYVHDCTYVYYNRMQSTIKAKLFIFFKYFSGIFTWQILLFY